jgi:hypothetical protein
LRASASDTRRGWCRAARAWNGCLVVYGNHRRQVIALGPPLP